MVQAMIKPSVLLCLIFIFLWVCVPILGQADDAVRHDPALFARLNPDGDKYNFVKHYLSALSELYALEKEAKSPQSFTEISLEGLRERSGQILQENVRLRVARNWVTRYRQSDNGLILKVNEIFSRACDGLIALNQREREWIDEVLNRDASGVSFNHEDIEEYQRIITELAGLRKDMNAGILESSIYVSKILISAERDQNGNMIQLGLTGEERRKLQLKANEFSYPKDTGEIQPGQTFVEGAVAVIRRVLDDETYGVIDG
jgi:hypothetical protein